MDKLNFPAFGETDFFKNRENETASVTVIQNADQSAFCAYCELLEKNGYCKREAKSRETHEYAAFQKGDEAVFLNHFGNVRELYIAEESECRYFEFADASKDASVSTTLTQMDLADFGMSYVIRLSDGRFIVLDGGRDFEIDREKLYDQLTKNSPYEKPIVAAWILTHPHSDHFHLFVSFMKRYGDEIVLEKVMFHFPDCNDLERYPKNASSDKRFDYNTSAVVWVPMMMEAIQRSGAAVYHPRTGQTYQIGNASLEILVCMDDTMHTSNKVNATSPVIRMELEGQIILFATDAAFSSAKLSQKYGSYLKADILQIPHHGFQSGDSDGEISGYKCIKPRVCLLPASSYDAFTSFSAHKKGTNFLMSEAGVEELITGSRRRTLTIPYAPSENGKAELEKAYRAGQSACGAKTWVFTGLNTENPEDFEFSFLNMTHMSPVVWIELFFESKDNCIRHIKATAPPLAMTKLSIVSEAVDPDALYFNWLSLKKQGIPENADFSVRFISDTPIVVSHKKHQATYTSNL